MKIAFFDTHSYDQLAFLKANEQFGFKFSWLEPRLCELNAPLCHGHDVVCSFVEDTIDRPTILLLKEYGVRLIALRSAGYNHVDLQAAKDMEMPVVRVPAYSPHAVAEHTVALLLNINRKIHRAYQRVRDGNFSLDGLVGFDLCRKKVGVIGTGKIGTAFAQIMLGFGCQVQAYDLNKNKQLLEKRVQYTSLEELLNTSDIISLHVPLTPQTNHLLNHQTFQMMKDNVIILNTSRGALLDSAALIQNLKSGKIKAAALDVYEEEEGVFFHDLSDAIIQDDVLARLMTFPNVLITAHQAFLTEEALTQIAMVTLENIKKFSQGQKSGNEI